jgi:hyaluronan synthase
MLIGLLQLRQSIQQHTHLYLFSLFVALTWLLWIVKVVLSRRYRPWTEPFETSTSVVIPVVDEPLELFRDVIRRIVAQQPTQLIVVINGNRNPALEQVCEDFGDSLQWLWTPVAGKRNAVRIGAEHAVGDVVVLVDSDTIWTPNVLSELVKPFAEPTIGGVTTRQRILDPNRNFLTRWADWLENSRALYAMPAQSVLGAVGCLPGRTIAFRRSVLRESMHAFMNGKFMGVFMEVSDDRTLTNLTLKAGYRTVYQATSLVYTDAPTKLKKMAKQQFRWARGSQYNTMRMTPWMLMHAPMLAVFFLLDIILPFLWVITAASWIVRYAHHNSVNLYQGMLASHTAHASIVAIVILTVVSSTLSMSLRQLRHLVERPADLVRMPLFIMFSTVVLMPIRIYGFFRMGHVGGWGTRAGAHTARTADELVVSEPALAYAMSPGSSGAVPLQDRRHGGASGAHEREGQPTDGDPRALLPYLIASAVLTLGVVYDALS